MAGAAGGMSRLASVTSSCRNCDALGAAKPKSADAQCCSWWTRDRVPSSVFSVRMDCSARRIWLSSSARPARSSATRMENM
jgi:hypothetical protein